LKLLKSTYVAVFQFGWKVVPWNCKKVTARACDTKSIDVIKVINTA